MQYIRIQHPTIRGLIIIEDFVSKQQEETLLSLFEAGTWEQVVSRRSQQFGNYYNQHKKWIEKKYIAFPEQFKFLITKLQKNEIMRYSQQQCSCLIQQYMPGQIIHPHIDQFGDIVIGINLAASTQMTFVHPDTNQKINVELKRRSLYILSEESRYNWKHGLLDIKKRRVSITIRNLVINEEKLAKLKNR